MVVALGLIPAAAARDRMEEGRRALLAARGSLLEGDLAAAGTGFAAAEDAFVRAEAHAGNPLLRVAGWVPVLGRTPDAVRGLAEAGSEVSRAGASLAAGVENLDGGLASLAPRRGRIDPGAYASLAPSLERASGHLRAAQAALAPVRTTWLLGPVADARAQFENELTPVRRGLEAAALIVRRFPAFLGADGVRRYVFVAENPAELRGTGGLFGSVALMTMRDGRISFGPFEPNERFPQIDPSRVPAPNDDYARRYPQASGFIVNANLTPDFPSAATALQGLYEASRGVDVDGVIAADPFALEAMLRISGDVTLPRVGTVTSENVVRLVSNEAYSLVTDGEARGRVLGQIAQVVLARFLAGAPAEDAATVLASAAGGGHLTLHTDDPELQQGLAAARADGALPGDAAGDLVGPIVNNGGGNKVDFYVERTVDLRIQLGAENAARTDLEITITNGAPARGQPVYVIGPNGVAERGENISLVSLYATGSAELLDYRQDAGPGAQGVGLDTELGHAVFDSSVAIASGESATVGYTLGTAGAWDGSTGHGSYRLTYLGQTTLNPTNVRIEIQAPEGTRIVRTSVPMAVQGNRAVWDGEVSTALQLEIEFQKPFPSRVWDALTGFFRKRLIEF